jgi:hypothetical protein
MNTAGKFLIEARLNEESLAFLRGATRAEGSAQRKKRTPKARPLSASWCVSIIFGASRTRISRSRLLRRRHLDAKPASDGGGYAAPVSFTLRQLWRVSLARVGAVRRRLLRRAG